MLCRRPRPGQRELIAGVNRIEESGKKNRRTRQEASTPVQHEPERLDEEHGHLPARVRVGRTVQSGEIEQPPVMPRWYSSSIQSEKPMPAVQVTSPKIPRNRADRRRRTRRSLRRKTAICPRVTELSGTIVPRRRSRPDAETGELLDPGVERFTKQGTSVKTVPVQAGGMWPSRAWTSGGRPPSAPA